MPPSTSFRTRRASWWIVPTWPAYVATEVPKLLAGKFRLTRRLGAGGMGAVYLARDLRLARDVAIKILTARSLGRLTGLTPEAWAMSTVTHPAVAQIHGVEFWRGSPCLVVEFLAGGTLEDRLRDGPLTPSQAVSVVARLADALAALHEKRCLHGDVKPSNIGFTAEGSPKLLDFGLAHAVDDAALVGGTLPYLSPEVLTGRPAEEADDVWSLCVVLYEMVSGRHPFAGGALEEVQSRIRRQRLAAGGPAAAAAPTAAAAVAAFAASVLTAPRGGRPGTAPAFAAALAEVPGTAQPKFLQPACPVLSCHTSQGTNGRQMRASCPKRHRSAPGGRAPVFDGLAARSLAQPLLSIDGRAAERVRVEYVSDNYFEVLQVDAEHGRTFLPGEGRRPGDAAFIVLTHRAWQTRFGGEPAILGQVVRLWPADMTVIGITPEAFTGASGVAPGELYALATEGALVEPGWTELLTNRLPERFLLMGRLRPDVTVGEAAAQLDVLADALAAEHPDASRDSELYVVAERHARPEPGASRYAKPLMSAVMGLATLVLLVAVANVVTLLIGRGVARRQEMAMRAGLGATRLRLVRQLVTESVLLALMGGAGGGIVAIWAVDFVMATQAAFDTSVDWRVFGFTAATAIAAGVLAGLAPALRSTRIDLARAIDSGGRSSDGGRSGTAPDERARRDPGRRVHGAPGLRGSLRAEQQERRRDRLRLSDRRSPGAVGRSARAGVRAGAGSRALPGDRRRSRRPARRPVRELGSPRPAGAGGELGERVHPRRRHRAGARRHERRREPCRPTLLRHRRHSGGPWPRFSRGGRGRRPSGGTRQ